MSSLAVQVMTLIVLSGGVENIIRRFGFDDGGDRLRQRVINLFSFLSKSSAQIS